ncbi:hybrid sensor histidine kinase/response regulator [Aquipseudomonas ullengensis]|uniref:histidine kinase n=1 Tax=Aquipseudomonas ullengensis TaxID=2759166 RepID=A0A7W4LJL7_9GAMM|nr:hybrid sensor histidine kinase/response regulator [Pseudomonas ullengensis]MBB2494378.1 hybrid sensor histidine kinase/response regulator [Pseudomonas ullengensis]
MLRKIEAKLLLVDDLPGNLLALEALIQGEDRTIFCASDAGQALGLLLEHDFAIAILDVQMPGMNGFELAELMRGTEKTKHIPIVFVSAAGRDLNYAFKGYESGAVDFLHKPLVPHEVRSKVAVFVELYRQRKALLRQLDALEQSRREQEALLAELRATQGELQNAVRMRDDFMSIVSHELRTPLNGLALEVQLRKLRLEQNRSDAFTLDRLRAITLRDEHQINSLTRLIDDMLDVSRIRTGKLSIRPQPCDLSQLASRVTENLAGLIGNAGCSLELQLEGPVNAEVDAFRIEQVLVNLLTNGLRYGAGKPIKVRVYGREADACIEVSDQGMGISVADQQRIFQQFERIAGNGVPQGLGLGLYISEQIVEAHGGHIELHSRLGEGACFRVVLPYGVAEVG